MRDITTSHPTDLLTEDNSEIFKAFLDIIKGSRKDKVRLACLLFDEITNLPNYPQAEAAFFWARRRGDCIEVSLDDLPDQGLGW